MQIGYVFTILFLAIGPLRVIPVFYAYTANTDRTYRLRTAALATAIAAAVIGVVALFGAGTLESWHVSRAALYIAIGILLLRSTFSSTASLEDLMRRGGEHIPEERDRAQSPAALAFSPIAVPTIVSATGVVTIALFLSIARSDLTLLHQIYGVLIFLLALNFAGMLLAEFVMRFIRIPTLAVVGWIFAALQAALAIEVTLAGLKLAGFAFH